MKGRIVFMMKKWWLIALVFTLALSLTSCSDRNLQAGTYVFSCDNTSLDLLIDYKTVKHADGSIRVALIPYHSGQATGDYVQVYLVRYSPGSLSNIGGSGTLYGEDVRGQGNAQEIDADFNQADVANHPYLLIAQQVPSFPNPLDPSYPGHFAACQLQF